MPLLATAERLGLAEVTVAGFESAAATLERVAHLCRPDSESFVNPAKSLALDLDGALPMIWGTSPLAGVAAARFACQLNEDAKYPAVHGVLPEAHHNQVVAFDGPFAPWPTWPGELRRGTAAPAGAPAPGHPGRQPGTSAGGAQARGLGRPGRGARHRGHPARRRGDQPLDRLASLVQLTDYAAVYLGIAAGLDPGPVAVIGDLKDRIA